MGTHTFYLAPEQWGEHCELHGQEAKHASQVLRVQIGEQIELIDGAGTKGTFCVTNISKKSVSLQRIHEEHLRRSAALPVIALAWSKATRRGFFMEKAVELGAYQIWIWQAEHSQGKVPPDAKESWQTQMIAGCKQSGNPWLPEILTLPQGIDGVIASSAAADIRLLPWESQDGVPILTPQQCGQAGTTVYVIGPEGGFSATELQKLATAHFTPVSLGSQILRCETAALLCLGIHWWAAHLHGHGGS